jgi:hypothetical protein
VPAARIQLTTLLLSAGVSACLSACIGQIAPATLEDPSLAGSNPYGPTSLPGTPTDPTAPPPTIVGPSVMVGTVSIEPGRVVAHRLNRVEYNNTVRDLFFGMDVRPADAFPIDNFAEGFDNNAQELSMSNLLMEKYLDAAEKIVTSAFANPQTRGRLVPACDLDKDAACLDKALTTFLERAYRRPVVAADLTPYTRLVQLARAQGDSAEIGLQVAMRAALAAPSFLYRIEPDPPQGKSRALGDFEVAARLSYFLWSSMPDDELFARGRAGALKDPEEVVRQTRRMLADPKAGALMDNLAGQWLYGRQIPELSPDPTTFPAPMFDDALRAAMQAEMTLFLKEVLLGDHSATELLKSNFTFANKRLAQHYGLPEAASLGSDMTKVMLSTPQRGGLLSQAGWLTVTSHPDSTSPIKRGKWILQELLCVPTPQPPPNVGDLAKVEQKGTLRQRLAIHIQNEPCKSCHALMDPLGFGLENYDAIGRWRDTDEGAPVDATGAMPGTGEKFAGASELATLLQKDARFGHCLTRKLLTFAVGRGMTDGDAAALDNLAMRFSAGGSRFRDLVEMVATSPLMTMRGGNSEP